MAQELADARKATEEAIAREAATADAVREAEVRGWKGWFEWMDASKKIPMCYENNPMGWLMEKTSGSFGIFVD